MNTKPVIVVHGGAIFDKKYADPTEYQDQFIPQYNAFMSEAINTGYTILKNGGTSLDAIIESAKIMENCGYFDAGKGAVKDKNGTFSLDASIMDGQTLKAGAVADCLVKNPSEIARLVMDTTGHVLIVGDGANQIAKENNKEVIEYSYFDNPHRNQTSEHGTIGVVALDTHGNLAAVTSTGGLTNKFPHRVGDSPIVGAGIYASNETCAVSCTGTGEFFIRTVAAFNIAARMKYGKQPLSAAAQASLDEITAMGALGGMICLDREGNIAAPYNCPGMFHGYIDKTGEMTIKMF
ncbi:isoaspartyl peptidase/L-asparaginase [soil metagenome]